MRFESEFGVRDQVIIDADASIVGFVTAVQFRGPESPSVVEVSYVHDGEQKVVWVEEWRLQRR